MKTTFKQRLYLLLIFSLLMISRTVLASTPASECASTLTQKFQGKIVYPETAQKQAIQGDVTVIFTVSDDGKIIVKDIRATDTELLKYIQDALTRVQVPELDNASIYDFKVIFHFKLV